MVLKTMLYMICLKTAFLKALVIIWDFGSCSAESNFGFFKLVLWDAVDEVGEGIYTKGSHRLNCINGQPGCRKARKALACTATQERSLLVVCAALGLKYKDGDLMGTGCFIAFLTPSAFNQPRRAKWLALWCLSVPMVLSNASLQRFSCRVWVRREDVELLGKMDREDGGLLGKKDLWWGSVFSPTLGAWEILWGLLACCLLALNEN